jgi:hypothetical protein
LKDIFNLGKLNMQKCSKGCQKYILRLLALLGSPVSPPQK